MLEIEEVILIFDEVKNIVFVLELLKMKLKVDSFEDFIYWMKIVVKLSEKILVDVVGRLVEIFFVVFLSLQFIKIFFFFGDLKFDVFYDVWRYEVECLLNELYKLEIIFYVIRWLFKGEVSCVVMYLGVGVFMRLILDKFDSIYGIVVEREDILVEFYSVW